MWMLLLPPLSALIKLEELNLRDNQITDVAPLAALVNLKTLLLDVNQITDITPLAALVNLEALFVRDNHIAYLIERPPAVQALRQRGVKVYI